MSLIPSTDKTWARSRSTALDEIGARAFNAIFSATTVYGLLFYAYMSHAYFGVQFSGWEQVGLIVLAFAGCFVAAMPTVFTSWIGLTMISGAFGVLSGSFLAQYKVASIVDIAFITMLITVVLGAAGTIYPKSLANWGSLLFTALVALVIAQFATIFVTMLFGIPMKGLNSFLDWAGVFLFSGYIVFDFNRSQFVTKTPVNAMECGVAVFLDILNLFLRLMSIFGVKTGSDD